MGTAAAAAEPLATHTHTLVHTCCQIFQVEAIRTLGKAWSGAILLLFSLLVTSKTHQELDPELHGLV